MYRLVVIDDEYIVVQGIKALLSRLKLDYEVVEEGSSGFLGIGAKPAVIKASVKKSSVEEVARVFLNDVFQAMNMEVVITIKYNEEEKSMDIE